VAFSARIGTDESGKGDYFGPLVVAGVAVRDAADEAFLRRLGVRDSKKVSDGRAAALAAEVERALPFARVVVGPARYNELYARIGNLNRLLAWGHARVLEDLLAKVPAIRLAVTDKFGDESRVAAALMPRGRAVELVQKVRAEEDPAVAAASIVARAEFLRRLAQLSARAGFPLPKGASASVEEAARRLAREKGADALGAFVKLHFKTTSRLGLASSA